MSSNLVVEASLDVLQVKGSCGRLAETLQVSVSRSGCYAWIHHPVQFEKQVLQWLQIEIRDALSKKVDSVLLFKFQNNRMAHK